MDYTRFLDFAEGETNIILSAPHGGNSRPPEMVTRKGGKKLQDTHTRKLAYKLVSTLNKPYYIVSNIHRKFVDLNRDIEEAEKNPIAEEIWKLWNDVLQYYTDEVRNKYKNGLYIDIHSHNNSDEFHLGYALSREDYLKIVHGDSQTETSLGALGDSLKDMLFGENSLKYQLEFYGYKVHNPLERDTYFGGGFNVRKFSNKSIGAIQLEIPVSILKVDMLGVCTALSNSLLQFKKTFVDN